MSKLYMFWTVPLSIIGSFSLYTQQWYMSYRFADSLTASRITTEFRPDPARCQAVSKPVWHIPLLCVQCKTPDDGQRKCPKHVEFYSKNKFEKLVHLVGFIIRIYHNAQSHEHQILQSFISQNISSVQQPHWETQILHNKYCCLPCVKSRLLQYKGWFMYLKFI